MASYAYGKQEIVQWLQTNFRKGDTCLDVGACDGIWYDMLSDFFNMDAVEIFTDNIIKHDLENKYNQVFNVNIVDLQYNYYDCIIFGDVIEHLNIDDAQKVLKYAESRCKDMIIAVPYNYRQGPLYNNPYERHIQDDLTDELFQQRYPGYVSLWQNDLYAYYHKANKNYDLSVIIPCHNLENYIEPMLHSLSMQNFNANIELMFICDACSDNTKTIINSYLSNLKKYSMVYVIEVNYYSAGLARNKGLDISSGKYIMFLDGDDWLTDVFAFQICIQTLNVHPEYQLLRYRFYGNELAKRSWNCKDNYQFSTVVVDTLWQYCYSKELIGDIRFPAEQPGEDTAFMEMIHKKITSYIQIDNYLYFYNFGRPNSNMTQFITKGQIEW